MDRGRFELPTEACKATVFPIIPTAQNINSKTKKIPIRISKDKNYTVSLKSKRHILIATKDSISEIRNKYVKFYITLLSKDI